MSPSISAQTITALPSTAGPSFARETEEETAGIGEATKEEESVGGERAFGGGEDTDSGAGDTVTTSKSSQEILSKFVDERLQVLDKEETESVAMFLCYHLVSTFSFTKNQGC